MSGAKGTLTIIGIGQGGERLTLEAHRAIGEATDIVGYRKYIKSLADVIDGQRVHEFGMGREIDRARLAIELAQAGHKVALVSSGDAGVYGMAGPVLEMIGAGKIDLAPVIVPGVTAASAAAAAVGAPLMNDFAVVSLSDIMTPWGEIARRLKAVAEADLVLVIYNPKSSKRTSQIEEAAKLLLKCRSGDTPVAIVRSAGAQETTSVTTLKQMCANEIDMNTTVIVGNSSTRRNKDVLFTPRGYTI